MEINFIADVHLGKLARLLRMLGFDTIYENNFVPGDLLKMSKDEDRILLSRNASLLKTLPDKCFIITDEDPLVQLKQVSGHFGLKDCFHPFSRCIVCNGVLEKVPKTNIEHLLQENTASYFNEFWQCSNCSRIYWKGSHYERMLKTIESLIQ